MKKTIVKHFQQEWKQFLGASIGIILYGIFINLLVWKFRLVSGGAPGYGLLINYLTGFPVGQFVLIINTILFVATFLFFGKGMSARGVYGYILLSLSIDISRNSMKISQTGSSPYMQILYNSLFGIIGGVFIGIVVFAGYSVGGYSIISLMINKIRKIPHENIFILLDALLGLLTLLVIGPFATLVLTFNAVAFFFSMKYTMQMLEKTKT